MKTVTLLLRDWRNGDRAALDQLMPIIYRELHDIAAAYTRGEHRAEALRPTELVSEAYLRLARGSVPDWQDRAHFFALAARAMRQILVDHARTLTAAKRGHDIPKVNLDNDSFGVAGESRAAELIAIDAAIEALAEISKRKAEIVEMHYFGGVSQVDIAAALDIHVNTVARDLRFAEAWIRRHVGAPST